jgi:hypothetical protein
MFDFELNTGYGMPNNTWIFVSKSYLQLFDGFYPNNLIFIRNVETNIAYS